MGEFFFLLIRMERYFGFSIANLREEKFGTREKEGWHIWRLFDDFLFLFFLSSSSFYIDR